MFWNFLIIAGVLWIILSLFSFIQTVQIKNIYKELEPLGSVYFGRDAAIFRTRFIAFASVDDNGAVVESRILKTSRFVTIAKILPFPELAGANLNTLQPAADLNLSVPFEHAVNNLIKNYKK